MSGTLVSVDDGNMHVIEIAPANEKAASAKVFDSLVLIHGASTSSLDFMPNLLPALSRRYPVLALDRPGHGYSDRGSRRHMDNPALQAEVALNTLAEMQIARPVIIGHSWGGSVVLAALLAEHDKVKPVAGVLIAGVTHPYEREDSLATKLALVPIYGPLFRYQYLAPVGRMAIAPTVERYFAPDKVPNNYIQKTGLHLSLRPRAYHSNAQDLFSLNAYLIDQSSKYSRITAPVLSISASEDHVVIPAKHHEKLIKALPQAKAVEIVGAGHLPHHTRTDEVVKAIRAFVDDLAQI